MAKNILHGLGQDSYLQTFDGREIACLSSDQTMTEGFEEWLESQEPFRYHPLKVALEPISVRVDQVKGKSYWYAFLRSGGKLRKRYVGQLPDLTPDHLESVAVALNHPSSGGEVRKPAKPRLTIDALKSIGQELLSDAQVTRNGKDRGAVKRTIEAFISSLNDFCR